MLCVTTNNKSISKLTLSLKNIICHKVIRLCSFQSDIQIVHETSDNAEMLTSLIDQFGLHLQEKESEVCVLVPCLLNL